MQLDEQLITAVPIGMIVFDTGGDLVRVNSYAQKVLSMLSIDTILLRQEQFEKELGIQRDTHLSKDTHKKITIGDNTLSMQIRAIEHDHTQYTLFVLQDISGQTGQFSRMNRHMLDTLWNMRNRVTSVQNSLHVLLNYECIGKSPEVDNLLIYSMFEVWYVSRLIETQRRLSLLNTNSVEQNLLLEPCNLRVLVKSAIFEVTPVKKRFNKNVTLLNNVPESVIVRADKRTAEYAIAALLLNAVMYSDANESVAVTLNTSDITAVALIVSDSGYGIPPQHQHKIFSYGFRADNAQRSRYPGSGTELYVTREFLRHMNSHIYFESNEGNGSVFTILFSGESGNEGSGN